VLGQGGAASLITGLFQGPASFFNDYILTSSLTFSQGVAGFYNDYFAGTAGGTTVLIIDPQRDFHPGGSLAIPSADDDSARIAAMLSAHVEAIDDIVVSLDTHQKLHVAHPLFWINAEGGHPAPFTPIEVAAVESGAWKTTDPRWQAWGLTYVTTLAQNKRFTLLIWPEHCLIGTSGHAVVDSVNAALHGWCAERARAVE
jgi:nicotinamidase-related amidase